MESIPILSGVPNSDINRSTSVLNSLENRTGPLDILTFLALSQKRNIDILPIIWYEALDAVGRGGTAEIREALVNLQTSFAFKCLKLDKENDDENIKKLTAELIVLSAPRVRAHPSIHSLLGICWDIDLQDNVGPVLVSEKSEYGNLEAFMTTNEGRNLILETRVKFCAEIASAVMTLHAAGSSTLIPILCCAFT
jgi:serine/threonine protein kinase